MIRIVNAGHGARMSLSLVRFASTGFKSERPEDIRALIKPIGLLSKPLPNDTGLASKSFAERKADFLDVKKNRIRREELKKEFSRSSFESIYNFRHTGGKIFTSPQSTFSSKDALYMPNIAATRIDGTTNVDTSLAHQLASDSPTLVRLFSSSLGQEQIKQFTEPLNLEELGVRLVDVNVATSWYNRLLVRWFANKIRRTETRGRAFHRYLVAKVKLPLETQRALAATNELAGYLYVVDRRGKIRWAASGPVLGNERDRLVSAIKQLKSEK